MQTVLGVAGWSGSGKSTLIERLLPQLAARGLAVSVIKHSHHDIQLDVPGKDSHRHRAAGAHEVMVVSPQRFGLFAETASELTLPEQLARLAPVDLVLLEGQKTLAVPKLEVWRPALGKPPRWPDDPHIIAVASDAPAQPGPRWLDLNDVAGVAGFIAEWLEAQK